MTERKEGLTTDALLRAHRAMMARFAKAMADGKVPMSASDDNPIHASEGC